MKNADDLLADIFVGTALLFGATLLSSGVELLMHSPLLSYLVLALEIEGIVLLVIFFANAFLPFRNEEEREVQSMEKTREYHPSENLEKMNPNPTPQLNPQLDSDLIPVDRWYDEEKGICVKALSKEGDNFTLCYKKLHSEPEKGDNTGNSENNRRN